MVIFPSAAEWKETPDIEEGAMVREQQTVLMIPDVNKMQVKVGVHESKVGRLRVGMPAKVQLQALNLVGQVDEIAEVTRPAGWWTGNMVKYDTVIRLDPRLGLKPGMSAVVDIVLADHKDVLKIPVAAIVETGEGFFCWVKNDQGAKKRLIELGDTNDEFTIVTAGLTEGEKVVLNPTAFLDEAQIEAMKPRQSYAEADSEDVVAGPKDAKGGADMKPTQGDSKKEQTAKQSVGAQVIAAGDKNSDGVLTEDEFEEKDRANFSKVDSNGDGKVTAGEIDAAIKAASGE
jgi:hypothetical protein